MTDVLTVLPDFDASPFSHLLLSFDRASIVTSELLTLDAVEIARRAQVPPIEVGKFAAAVLKALQEQLEESPIREWQTISLLEPVIDEALGGGFPVGYLTEITGESGAGKTQFLLTALLSAQLPAPHGISKSAIYVSTEAPLSTSRLSQLLSSHPSFNSPTSDAKPTLSRVHSIKTSDLESQEHILRYQLPVAIERFGAGLVVIDSIASNYRAEFDGASGPLTSNNNGNTGTTPSRRPSGQVMAERRTQLVQMGAYLRELARKFNVAVVVANQVADRFVPDSIPNLMPGGDSGFPTSDPLTLDHQQRWYTGWGDLRDVESSKSMKTPSLGLVWTNQIAARIALIKGTDYQGHKTRRWMRLVFSPWAAQTLGRGIEYEITGEGIKSVP